VCTAQSYRAVHQNFELPELPAVPAISTTTASTTATASAATAAEPASTTATCRLRASFIYVKRPAIHFRAIQLRDRIFRIPLFRHFHEGKPARLPCVTVRHNVYTLDVTVLRKRRVQFVLRRLIAQISDKDIRHALLLRLETHLCQTNTGGDAAGRA
jgi:hypothetical protein